MSNHFGATATTVADVHLRLEVRDKRFGWYMENHHGNGRINCECKAPPGAAAVYVAENPGLFYIPSYGGSRGWICFWLDLDTLDWDVFEQMLRTAYEMTVPRSFSKG